VSGWAARPYVLAEASLGEVASALRGLHAVLEELVLAFPEDPRLQQYFPDHHELMRFICQLPPYRPVLRIARIDGVITPSGVLKVFDINTACPGGVIQTPRATSNWWNRHQQALVEQFGEVKPLWLDEDAFTGELLSCVDDLAGEISPGAALVNYRGVYTTELEDIRSSFARRGVECRILDATELIASGPSAWIPRLIYNKLDPLAIAGSDDGRSYLALQSSPRICSLSALIGQYVTEDKRSFAILSDPESPLRLTHHHRWLVDRHLPWTRMLRDGDVSGPDGRTVNARELAIREQGELVLKRGNATHGEGTTIGKLVPRELWRARVDEAVAAGDAVVQQFEQLPTDISSEEGDGAYLGLDCFLFGGELVGIRCRASRDELLSLGPSGVLRPVVVQR
jgi:hypothetical protein